MPQQAKQSKDFAAEQLLLNGVVYTGAARVQKREQVSDHFVTEAPALVSSIAWTMAATMP